MEHGTCKPKLLELLKHWLCEAPVTLLISIVTLALFNLPTLTSHFEWRNDLSSSNMLLSLFGCHLLHWNAEHLFWDLCMFSITGLLCEKSCRNAYYGTLLMSAVTIPLFVMWFHPALSSYRGLSGLDTALFALLITRTGLIANNEGDRLRFWGCLGLWLAMLSKSLFEFSTGHVMFVDADNFVPIPVAHLVGIVCGTLFALTARLVDWTGGVVEIKSPKPELTRDTLILPSD